MFEYYFLAIVLLFVLAISDLVVGVSNDAVNFLNSAIGSQVASKKIIMLVASFGIMLGATFSSGMIEVARKGIFNPDMFFLSEIMVIFLAVMITDIILLDMFNTFGMPTSTTVSIVFELLGAAVAVAFLKLSAQPNSGHALSEFINSSRAITIISGIFISVFIAFITGSFVQYFSRLLFTYQSQNRMSWVGPIWSALALTALTFFLLIKGIKGASFVSDDFILWSQQNRITLMGSSFIFWFFIMQICVSFFKLNILRFVVLFGTFSLAMAFAGNDLVNFIGVPIAGLESYLAWIKSGTDAGQFSMEILNQPVRTDTYLLALAGIIMVMTLWVSKKSRSVTETEVNLGRQEEGMERFTPNTLSKGIVRLVLPLGSFFQKILPENWTDKAQVGLSPYLEPIPASGIYEPPAFDLVRASVNLTTASVLIAIATSFKLPLSTTYVSFMVAMGASLADKAWGRNSAVYRVAGVLNVIGGWLFTAFIAFFVSSIFATLIYYFKGYAVVGLILLIVFIVSRTFILHKNKSHDKSRINDFENQTHTINVEKIIDETRDKVLSTLNILATCYTDAIIGLIAENRKTLKKANKDIQQLNEENKLLQHRLFKLIKRTEMENKHSSKIYLLVYNLEQDVVQSMSLISSSCFEYVDSSLKPLQSTEAEYLQSIEYNISAYFQQLITAISSLETDQINRVMEMKQHIFSELEEIISEIVTRIQNLDLGRRKSQLLFDILLETKDITATTFRFLKLYNRINELQQNGNLSLISGKETD